MLQKLSICVIMVLMTPFMSSQSSSDRFFISCVETGIDAVHAARIFVCKAKDGHNYEVTVRRLR